ncbi:rRNA-processing protein sof1 [Puccinia graminis f. sp. tritici]|uniref:DDB1- and CUL4-associated factor 13 n=2 Tax=Puccinia graminis f. sp. tritici TaxID=56615 RepID=A0A5B0P3J2_PUCGR|nr:rRNA-processing protein sof1 [Puccinia graminis f. sp. tritici]
MKVKVLSRSLDNFMPIAHGAPAPIHKNLDPTLHPHSRAREYTRAVTATKLNRMFAKPFVGQLDGHRDSVYTMAKDPLKLTQVASGSGDGDVRVWDLANRISTISLKDAHKGKVTGLTFLPNRYIGEGRSKTYDQSQASSSKRLSLLDPSGLLDEEEGINEDILADLKENEELHEAEERTSRLGSRKLLSCGIDKVVKMWDIGPGANFESEQDRLVMTYQGKHGFNSIDHHRHQPLFVTASDRIQLWDVTKSSPLSDVSWNSSRAEGSTSKSSDNYSGEQIACVTFSPSETSVLASSGSSSNRAITLYDLRSNKSLGQLIMKMRVNCLKFNPQQPSTLLAGGEDHQLYTFDIRYMGSATQVFKDHVGPVMSCDWSPTGRGFVSGSYDRTLRLWSTSDTTLHKKGRSTDVYHTKRMQRIFASLYSCDSQYVLSGSDDGAVRIWKAGASDPVGVKSGRELAAKEYRDQLRQKWSSIDTVSKIERQRYLPKPIYHAQKLRTEMLEARAKKEDNRQAHSSSKKRKNLASSDLENDKKKAKSGKPKVINERKKGLLAIQE